MSEEPKGESGASSDDRLVSLLAYVLTPLAPVIILLMEDKKSRPFIRAHNAQALIWGVLLVVVSIPSTVCLFAPSLILWAIGVYWGIKAYQGEYVNIPVITDLTKNQGWA
ncbi:MAG: DUF4870 domain-containing protein [Anaerolineales bacterium]